MSIYWKSNLPAYITCRGKKNKKTACPFHHVRSEILVGQQRLRLDLVITQSWSCQSECQYAHVTIRIHLKEGPNEFRSLDWESRILTIKPGNLYSMRDDRMLSWWTVEQKQMECFKSTRMKDAINMEHTELKLNFCRENTSLDPW